MRVEINISEEVAEPYAVIYADALTEEVQRAASALRTSETAIAAKDNGRIVVLSPSEIYMVRVEGSTTMVRCKTAAYSIDKRLYEMETLLGPGFMRISKSAIVNLKALHSVEPSFSGMLLLNLKNGDKDYISRKYLPNFKRFLKL